MKRKGTEKMTGDYNFWNNLKMFILAALALFALVCLACSAVYENPDWMVWIFPNWLEL